MKGREGIVSSRITSAFPKKEFGMLKKWGIVEKDFRWK